MDKLILNFIPKKYQPVILTMLSKQAVTEITKEIEGERLAWETRPLKKRYTIIFIDALFVKIRRDKVASDAIYPLAGIDEEGYRDILVNRWIDRIEVLMTS